MSTVNLPPAPILPDASAMTVAAPNGVAAERPRCPIVVQDRITIPGGIDDLDSYRRWAYSDDYPQSGWVSFLDGTIWVDPDMEELITHNRVKSAFAYAIMHLLRADSKGSFVSDRMLLTNRLANLSTEPDGLCYLWPTMQEGRLRLVPGKSTGYMELEGSPDMVLEVVSESSKRKDKEMLRELYWKAGIAEYWLVDALTDPAQFSLWRHADEGFVPSATTDGWVTSQVLGKQFRLVKQPDPLGHPDFVVEVR